MQGRVGEVELAMDRRQASFVVAAAATIQSGCEIVFRVKRSQIPSVGFGLGCFGNRVRSTRLAWGAAVWRRTAPELPLRRPS